MAKAKLDLKKLEHDFYTAPKSRAVVVDIPEEAFLMIDGRGSPNEGTAFQEAIGALYSVAYSLKFEVKKADPSRDYTIMPVEALWWWDGGKTFQDTPEKEWRWTLMIRQPDFVSPEVVEKAIADAALVRPGAAQVRFGRFREGRCMQILHVGPYKSEWPTIQRLHGAIKENGWEISGKHHEIYLGDPRRAKPENLRTIIRQPVRAPDAVSR